MTDIILTEIKNGVGIITLNSPRTLNAISKDMADALLLKLIEWKNDKRVRCLFFQGNLKAFCAGGDVKNLYVAIKNNPTQNITKDALEFFILEYTLDFTIHTYSKPIIAWGDGIVMGGGLGIFVGASHRIVTQRSQLAMPEISIGLYPDVGGTWFLNRMPNNWGIYFGLTGARMTGGDAQFLGLADYVINSDLKESFINKLLIQDWDLSSEQNKKKIDTLLSEIASNEAFSPAKERIDFSNTLININSVLEFKTILEREAIEDEWIQAGLLSFQAGSPTSAMVIYEQLKRGKSLNLKEVFYSELNLSVHFSLSPDFPEGVRALLIDKDQRPNWQPSTLESVDQMRIDSYFIPIWDNLVHPLNTFEAMGDKIVN